MTGIEKHDGQVAKHFLVFLPFAFVTVFAATCHTETDQCPHTFVDSAGVAREIELVGPLTNVPEFHDCQRFIDENLLYGAPYAIYVRQFAASAFGRLEDTLNIPERGGVENRQQLIPGGDLIQPGNGNGITVAVIYSYGGTYPQLGIEPWFNCLYFIRDGLQLSARVVPVGTNDSLCARDLPPGSTQGTPLQVTRTLPYQVQDSAAYPLAARWHWDERERLQFIGLTCDLAYCLVGPEHFAPQREPLGAVAAGISPELTIPAWHDEQRLAVAGLANALVPGRIIARIFPHPDLGTYTMPDFLEDDPAQPGMQRRFLPAAFIHTSADIPGYAEKLNLRAGHLPDGVSRIELCHGSYSECGVQAVDLKEWDGGWWARIISADGMTVFKRVKHHTYEYGIPVPGLVRWRWRSDDEMTWIRCPEGCCESIE